MAAPYDPTHIVVTCPLCGHGNVFRQPYPYHAGYGNQGFLYNEAGDRTLTWNSSDPAYTAVVGAKHPWELTPAEREELEERLEPAPSGGRWKFSNPARCQRCGAPISGPMTQTIYYLHFDGSVDRDAWRNGGLGLRGLLRALRTTVPWKTRDVWLGVAMAAVIVFGAYGLIYLVASLGVRPNVDLWTAIVPTLFELLLLLPVWWFARRKYHAPLRPLGFKKFPGVTLAYGFPLLIACYLYIGVYRLILAHWGLEMQGGTSPLVDRLATPWPLVFSTVIVAPLVEETLFRGFIFNGLRTRHHWAVAATISAALFAAAHMELTFFIPAFVLGFLFAFLYERSDSVWPGMILHFCVNGLAMTLLLT